MDRNSIIGLLLIFGIILGYSWYTQPSPERLKQIQAQKDSIALVKKEQLADSINKVLNSEIEEAPVIDSATLIAEYGGFAKHVNQPLEIIQIENDKIELSISNKGAKPTSAILKEFFIPDSSRKVNLIDSNGNFNLAYSFSTKDKVVNTANFYWDVVSKESNSIKLRMYYGSATKYLEQIYELKEGDYKVYYTFNVVGMQSELPPGNKTIKLNLANNIPLQEATIDAEKMATTVYWKYEEESPDYIRESSYDVENLEEKTQWVSFKQQFFNTTFIPKNSFDKGGELETVKGDEKTIIESIKANLEIPYNHTPAESFSMNIYMGPNKYKVLKKEGMELERLVSLGPIIIRHINKGVVVLFDFLKSITTNYGLLILLLTVIIKTALFPLVYKSYKSMAKMRVLKPEIDAIKEKYEGETQKIQQENMALYRKAGVNPAGGCLPMIIQMPVLFAMFRFFPSAFDLRQQGFLWATDLSRFDSVLHLGFDIPFYGSHVSLFTLLMTVTTLVYTRFNNQMSGATGQMKWIGYLMPIMFLGFFNNYASGLTYYYFVSTLITFSQQIVIRKFFIDEDKIRLQLAENQKNPKKKKASGFQKRLEDMANKQQEINKNRKKK